jgi:hypothetical protein
MEPEDKTIAYQREVEALYANAVHFKRVFFPADPSKEGVLVDAANLDVLELVAIFRAAKNLEPKHLPAVNNLILPRSAANLTPLVRVNPQFVDCRRQQKIKVCELLHEFFYGDCASFAAKWQEIVDMGDAQLLKFLQQVEEALGFPERELKIMEAKE